MSCVTIKLLLSLLLDHSSPVGLRDALGPADGKEGSPIPRWWQGTQERCSKLVMGLCETNALRLSAECTPLMCVLGALGVGHLPGLPSHHAIHHRTQQQMEPVRATDPFAYASGSVSAAVAGPTQAATANVLCAAAAAATACVCYSDRA